MDEFYIDEKGHDKNKSPQNEIWKKVISRKDNTEIAGLVFAIIEADKALFGLLDKKGFPGKSFEQKLVSAKHEFSNIAKVEKAREIKKEILEEEITNLTSVDLEETLNNYKQAILDLGEPAKKLSLTEKILLNFDFYFPKNINFIKKFLIYSIVFVVVVWFFANTSYGQSVIDFVVSVVNFIFNWILAIFLVILALAVTVVGSIVYFEKRKRNQL